MLLCLFLYLTAFQRPPTSKWLTYGLSQPCVFHLLRWFSQNAAVIKQFFFKVLLQTVIDSYRDFDVLPTASHDAREPLFTPVDSFDKNKEKLILEDTNKANNNAKIVKMVQIILILGIPFMFLVFSVFYWLVGFTIYYGWL